jgi:hypothetical protein
MQDVYEHATINISANAALDSTAGLNTRERLQSEIGVRNTKDGDPVYVRLIYDNADSCRISHIPDKKR